MGFQHGSLPLCLISLFPVPVFVPIPKRLYFAANCLVNIGKKNVFQFTVGRLYALIAQSFQQDFIYIKRVPSLIDKESFSVTAKVHNIMGDKDFSLFIRLSQDKFIAIGSAFRAGEIHKILVCVSKK